MLLYYALHISPFYTYKRSGEDIIPHRLTAAARHMLFRARYKYLNSLSLLFSRSIVVRVSTGLEGFLGQF